MKACRFLAVPLMSLTVYVSSGHAAGMLTPFEAHYSAEYNGVDVKATRSLKKNGDLFEFRFAADCWLASMLEVSRFRWQDGRIQPHEYSYQRKVFGRSREAQVSFDWQDHSADFQSHKQSGKLDLEANVLDKLNYQLQMRHDLLNNIAPMNYQVVDIHKLKDYEFSVVGEEVIETQAGKLATYRVERVRDDEQRKTLFWLARDWNFLVVRLQQFEQGKLKFEINLSEAQVNGTPLLGL